VWAPNGFEPDSFDRREIDRRAVWREWLVEEPRGWDPSSCEPGSVSYSDEDLDALDGTVLVYSGRYTEVKRIPLLVRAFARASFSSPAALVLIGGYPGEWEGEHPLEVVRETGASNVFLAGWRGHDDLPDGLNASDAVVLPSVHEQFGQVLVEGMACGLPCIAVDAHGPATIVDDGSTGWLVPPDDEDALVAALEEAVNSPDERRRRGEEAYREARGKYSWPALVERLARVYEEVRTGS
jgi:glycosyltransferase involved in cell wall biosynthesis